MQVDLALLEADLAGRTVLQHGERDPGEGRLLAVVAVVAGHREGLSGDEAVQLVRAGAHHLVLAVDEVLVHDGQVRQVRPQQAVRLDQADRHGVGVDRLERLHVVEQVGDPLAAGAERVDVRQRRDDVVRGQRVAVLPGDVGAQLDGPGELVGGDLGLADRQQRHGLQRVVVGVERLDDGLGDPARHLGPGVQRVDVARRRRHTHLQDAVLVALEDTRADVLGAARGQQ